MNSRLVFVHGRSQQHKDAGALKAEWIDAWKRGLKKSGLEMPIAEEDIRFPYYGQTLYDLVNGPDDDAADVIVRGAAEDDKEVEFLRSVLEEVKDKKRITDDDIAAAAGEEIVLRRGMLNWEWVHGILKALDRLPRVSAGSIALATRDVYQYLRNPGIKNRIDVGVRAALVPDVPTVVVAHSLGTVVAYDLLRRDGAHSGWKVPLLVTLGSPLGVTAIRRALRPIDFPACADAWFNALDVGDVVALYPLAAPRFDVTPKIENNTEVENSTTNQHGISGYLDDETVARRIYHALLAPGG